MIKSLLLKLGMLSLTIGVVFWARWAPPPPAHGSPSPADNQVVASRTMELEARESRSSSSSTQNVQGPNMVAVAQTEPLKPGIRSRLDLNRASADELETLPGIGSVLAQRVIAFRKSAGRFQKIEDLRAVKGIGAKKYDRLKSLVTVSAGDSKRETERRES